MILVEKPGSLTLVEDLGRPGHAHLAVARSGAADRPACIRANRRVGNADGAAVLELDHGSDVAFHGGQAQLGVVVGVAAAVDVGLLRSHEHGDVAHHLVGAGLVGEGVGDDVTLEQPFEQFDRVAVDADAERQVLEAVAHRGVDGLIDYDASLDSLLSGRGTKTLVFKRQ